MTKQAFIDSYITGFLSSYAALTYDFNCQRGWPNKQQPVEDAEHLAEEAWEQYVKHLW